MVRLLAESGFGLRAEEDKPDLTDAGWGPAMSHDFLEHDPRALLQRKTRDPSADRWEGDGPQAAQVGDLEAAAGGAAQAVSAGPASQSHARRMDDEACLQAAAAGYGRVADLDRAELAALGLDRRPACPGDR